ncbi:MAG: hemerythrin domain-containing protein [Bacillaceae bacterium]|nr:hemerythrin domain-containing protein [Bacillaceae bacterium]
MNFSCAGSFGDPKLLNYCKPLKQLIDEHPSLLAKMDEFHEMILQYETTTRDNWYEIIIHLQEKLSVFVKELEPHAEKEENLLFEMLIPYLGRESGPIAVMEHEHHLAKKDLKKFQDEASFIKSQKQPVNQEKAFQLFDHLKTVYTTLTSHFMKEEQVLFPLAEQTFSEDEKQILEVKFDIANSKK